MHPLLSIHLFLFVKPCGAHGDVTLKDINQRIRTPQSKTAQSSVDPSVAYPEVCFLCSYRDVAYAYWSAPLVAACCAYRHGTLT
ncbi:hypothetical protein HAX54_005027 [Datura stramonium]|uniref:Secreted protein n=1 Tax=Datura stramonium TaxID=4076 RepID=A0ABS8T9A9_DATST|nr:hypothetical protein [Datura stramonium]